MNTVRIFSSDAKPFETDSGDLVISKDKIISVPSNWSAEELAVLARLDLDDIQRRYSYITELYPFTIYLRSHIQEILKRQEGK